MHMPQNAAIHQKSLAKILTSLYRYRWKAARCVKNGMMVKNQPALLKVKQDINEKYPPEIVKAASPQARKES